MEHRFNFQNSLFKNQKQLNISEQLLYYVCQSEPTSPDPPQVGQSPRPWHSGHARLPDTIPVPPQDLQTFSPLQVGQIVYPYSTVFHAPIDAGPAVSPTV